MNITCYQCKKTQPLSVVSGRAVLAFRDTCVQCGADLHACLNCSLYDSGAYHECRESSAEWVKDKEKANKCEYLIVKGSAQAEGKDPASVAKALNDLFKD